MRNKTAGFVLAGLAALLALNARAAETKETRLPYVAGCDRMSISPDGKTIYVPSLEGAHWHVVDAATGDVLAKIVTNSGAHNTVYGSDGSRVYLAGLRSPWLTLAETKTHTSNTC